MKILITSEVKEELEDIIELLKEVDQDNIVYYCPELINLKNRTYFYSKFSNKYLKKITELLFYIRFVMDYKPDLIFSGASMLKHRLVSLLFNKKHFVYFRGLLFDPSNISGISDGLRFGKLKCFFKGNLFNAFYGSLIFTTSNLNKNFIISRGISSDRIKVIGPVWLSSLTLSKPSASKRYYFVTQAFAEHGFARQQSEQLDSIKSLFAVFSSRNKANEFHIRVHPRDFYAYENDHILKNAKIDRSFSKDFLRQLNSEDILITPLSTLAFEAKYLGVKTVFYASDTLNEVYEKSYVRLGIKPLFIKDITIDLIEDYKCNVGVFSKIDIKAVQDEFHNWSC